MLSDCAIIRKGSECIYEREKMELSDCISLITVSSKERRYILAEANVAFDVVFTQLTNRQAFKPCYLPPHLDLI